MKTQNVKTLEIFQTPISDTFKYFRVEIIFKYDFIFQKI